MKVALFDQHKKEIGTVELQESVFGGSVNVPLVHQVLKAQLANRRQGTAKTKVKSEVRGGGKKPFRQKGTGNARQGSSRSPLQPGGGQNFGPQPRSYHQATPKEMVRGALRSVLRDRLRSERLFIINEFSFEKPQTRVLGKLLSQQWGLSKVLLIDDKNTHLELSGRNLPEVTVLRAERLNVYDVIQRDWVLMTQRALRQIESRLGEEVLSA